MKFDVRLKGLASQPSDYKTEEGSASAVVNMEMTTAGELCCVRPDSIVAKLPEGVKTMCIHKTAEYEHFVARRGNDIVWFEKSSTDDKRITEAELNVLSGNGVSVNCVEANGNIVSLIGDTNIVYAVWGWDDREHRNRYHLFDKSKLTIDVEVEAEPGNNVDYSKVWGMLGHNVPYTGIRYKNLPSETRNCIVAMTQATEAPTDKELPSGGTSIRLTANEVKSIYAELTSAKDRLVEDNGDIITDTAMMVVVVKNGLGNVVAQTNIMTLLPPGMSHYMMPIENENSIYIPDVDEMWLFGPDKKNMMMTVPASRYVVKGSIKYEGSPVESGSVMEDLVSTVEVYVTRGSAYYNLTKDYGARKMKVSGGGTDGSEVYVIGLEHLEGDSLHEAVAQEVFYRSMRMSVADFAKGNRLKPAEGTESALDMTNFGRTMIGAKTSYSYNGRLIVGNVTKSEGDGYDDKTASFRYGNVEYGGAIRNGVVQDSLTNGTSKRLTSSKNAKVYAVVYLKNPYRTKVIGYKGGDNYIPYPLDAVWMYPNRDAYKARVYVDFGDSNSSGVSYNKVYWKDLQLKPSDGMNASLYINTVSEEGVRYSGVKKGRLAPIQARDLTMSGTGEPLYRFAPGYSQTFAGGEVTEDTAMNDMMWNREKSNSDVYDAETSEGWIELEGVTLRWMDGKLEIDNGDGIRHIYESTDDIADPGKVRASEVDDPMVWPNENVKTMGEDVMRLVSNTTALSEGQAGQHPIYVFTRGGIWAMPIDGEGMMGAPIPVSRDVMTNEGAMAQTDNAVVYAAADGIKLLSGAQTRVLSELLDGERAMLSEMHMMKSVMMAIGMKKDDADRGYLEDYLEECKIAVDTRGGRIIVYNDKYDYSYVYQTAAGGWSTVKKRYSGALNSYPECLMKTECDERETIVDTWNRERNERGEKTMSEGGIWISRPLHWGSPGVMKRLKEIAVRGRAKDEHLKIVVWGSRDLDKWSVVASAKGARLRAEGSPYKWFRVGVIAELDADETLREIEAVVNATEKNKLR